jgi:hypothetical protein
MERSDIAPYQAEEIWRTGPSGRNAGLAAAVYFRIADQPGAIQGAPPNESDAVNC